MVPIPKSPSVLGSSPAISTYQNERKLSSSSPSSTPSAHQGKSTGPENPGTVPTDLYWKYPWLKHLKFTATKNHTPRARFTIPEPLFLEDGGKFKHEIPTNLLVAFPELAPVTSNLADAVCSTQFSGQPRFHALPPQSRSRRNGTLGITNQDSRDTWPAKSLCLISRPRQNLLDQPELPLCCYCQARHPVDQRGCRVQCRHTKERYPAKEPYPIRQSKPFKQPTITETVKGGLPDSRIQSSFGVRCERWWMLVGKEP